MDSQLLYFCRLTLYSLFCLLHTPISGLTIGGYESAFLADLVASYLFEKAKPIFHPTIYHGIYRDDGLLVFKEKRKASDIKDWLEEFQQSVNMAAGNQHLKFTAEIWTDGANPPTLEKEDQVQSVTNDELTFLDMKMIKDRNWNTSAKRAPTHPILSARSPPESSTDLSKLTSRKPSIQAEAADTIYPAHTNALRKEGLAPPGFPSMGELWEKQDEKVDKNKERDVSVKENRNVYFCVAYSRYFSTAIHRVINRLKKSFNLTWLRVRMSYHRFINLAELLNGDLAA